MAAYTALAFWCGKVDVSEQVLSKLFLSSNHMCIFCWRNITVRKHLQECHDLVLLFIGQLKVAYLCIHVLEHFRRWPAVHAGTCVRCGGAVAQNISGVVEMNDLFKSPEHAVMHVRRSKIYVSQRGSFL